MKWDSADVQEVSKIAGLAEVRDLQILLLQNAHVFPEVWCQEV
jgi:hypothetical protein